MLQSALISMSNQDQAPVSTEKRIIKRYSNRKLYDTQESRYVTLQQIGEMVRQGEDVQIIDNKTKEDKTEVTLALIISEELKNKPSSVPLGTLRHLIQERSEKFLSQLRDGPIGRLIPVQPEDGEEGGVEPAEVVPAPETEGGPVADRPSAKARLNELVETSRHTFDELQATLDDRVKALVPGSGPVRELRAQLAALTQRIEAIEKNLGISAGAPTKDE